MKRIIILLFLSLLTQVNFAQFPNFSIGGLSRAISNTSYLDSNDSINEDINQKFNIIFDMAIDGKLNKHVNFYSELRLGSSLDVFDTSASYIDLRRILVFGEFNKNLSFEVGDVDLIMTPFTLWNNYEEGNIHESQLFSNYRDVQRYENFNNGNFWRRQGFQIFGNSRVGEKDTLNYKVFGTRERSSNEISIPDVFLYGEHISFEKSTFEIGFNHIDLFTNNRGILIDSNFHNHVVSSNIDVSANKLKISAEGGLSYLTNYSMNTDWVRGEFLYIEANYQFNKSISFDLNFRSVTDDFSSPGAQSKRINYSSYPNLFPNLINSSSNRFINSADIVSDISLFRSNSIFNRTIDYGLDDFNPQFGLADPYGLSTPNRRGFSSVFNFEDSLQKIKIFAEFTYLNDLTGEGVSQKRNYNKYAVGGLIKVGEFLNFKKEINLYGGFSLNTVNRIHPSEMNVNAVDFNNTLLDLALDFEILNDLYFLAGIKKINADGIDYLPLRGDDFSILSYNLYSANLSEQITALGLKYNFSDNSSLLVNYQLLNREDFQNETSFSTNQFFVLIQIAF